MYQDELKAKVMPLEEAIQELETKDSVTVLNTQYVVMKAEDENDEDSTEDIWISINKTAITIAD
jgi:hypothetical protein